MSACRFCSNEMVDGMIHDCPPIVSGLNVDMQENDLAKGLRYQITRHRESLAAMMIRHGFATRHGNTPEQLLGDLDLQLASLKAEHASEIASITSLLKWAEEDWVEIECGPASGREGLEITVLRLEPTQGEQRIFRASTILGALRLAHDTPRFQGETVPQFYGRATQEVLEARQEIERLTKERDSFEEQAQVAFRVFNRKSDSQRLEITRLKDQISQMQLRLEGGPR